MSRLHSFPLALLAFLTLFITFSTSISFDFSRDSKSQPQQILGDGDGTRDETYSVPGKNPLNFCADPRDYILTIDKVDLTPNPPQAGTDLLISATGTSTANITSGAHALISVKLRLNYGGQIPLLQRDEDLCNLLERDDDIDQKCPVEKDKKIKVEKTVKIPDRVPKGKFVVLIDALTEGSEKITCLMTEIEF